MADPVRRTLYDSTKRWLDKTHIDKIEYRWRLDQSYSARVEKQRLLLSENFPDYSAFIRRAVWLSKRQECTDPNTRWIERVTAILLTNQHEITKISETEWAKIETQGQARFVTYRTWDGPSSTWWLECEDINTDAQSTAIHQSMCGIFLEVIENGEKELNRLVILNDEDLNNEYLNARDDAMLLDVKLTSADYAIDVKLEFWTTDEATAIVMGQNRKILNSQTVSLLPDNSPFRKKFYELHEFIERAAKKDRFGQDGTIEPKKLCDWLLTRGMPEAEKFAIKFYTAVDNNVKQITDRIEEFLPAGKAQNTVYGLILTMEIKQYHMPEKIKKEHEFSHLEFNRELMRSDMASTGFKVNNNALRELLDKAVTYVNSKHPNITRDIDKKPRLDFS